MPGILTVHALLLGLIAALGSPQQAPLENTTWKLTNLSGADIKSQPGARELYFRLDARSKHVEGFGVCNRFSGEYTTQKSTLRLKIAATTTMACLDRVQLEGSFLNSLSQTTEYRINAGKLELIDREMRLLARFQPQVE